MKLITWNCNMAFRNKAAQVLALKPDIVVVPECEHPEKLIFTPGVEQPVDRLWIGQNPHKGLGVFSYGEYRLKMHRSHNRALQLIAPIAVSKGSFRFHLLAIWANHPTDKDGRYITQVWKAIHHYHKLLDKKPVILAGDFNSNTIWDKPRREGNHSTVVSSLAEKGIHSVYHQHFKQEQGKEEHPTLYMYRKKEKCYHIDYCFASSDLLTHLSSVEIGDFNDWCTYSDHVPVITTFSETLFK